MKSTEEGMGRHCAARNIYTIYNNESIAFNCEAPVPPPHHPLFPLSIFVFFLTNIKYKECFKILTLQIQSFTFRNYLVTNFINPTISNFSNPFI